ncbi:hypothetical protein WP3W19E03_17750 [Aeromonas veronii]|uniref:Uncharacterized protein n=2 Tax=Aeromonas veronii TaxID=654 RepID=A0A6S5BUR7_AERVE|nr:hypothetical protein WP3W19E03_17750 [Aeromonas veronii]
MNVKNTTMLWKRMNYSAQTGRVNKTAGLSQLKTSLNHSLRTVMKRELEFNQALANRNYIILDNKIFQLDKLSIEQRQKIVNDILGDIHDDISAHRDKTQLKDDRAKYAYKLKKMLTKTDEPENFKCLVSTVLEAKEAIDPTLINNLTSMGLKRVNDKKNAISTYIALHNEIISASNNSLHRSKTVLQECFFKFPARNKISEVKPADYLKIIHGFHRKNFPNYPIKACVFHGDEVVSQDQINNGVHPHIFISGKNAKTGKYDLIKSQLDFVNEHLKAAGEPEIYENSYNSAQKIGETYQKIVYEHVNKKLKEFGYSIEASIHEKTAEHKAKIEKIKQDENKAKIFRNFNLLSQTEEEIKKRKSETAELQSVINKKQNQVTTLNNKMDVKQNEYKSAVAELNEKFNQHKESLMPEIRQLTKSKKNLISDNDSLSKKNTELNEALANVDNAIMVLAFRHKEQHGIQEAFKRFKNENLKALKRLSSKDRTDFIAAQNERLKKEELDKIITANLTYTEKARLAIYDTAQSIQGTYTKVKQKISGP